MPILPQQQSPQAQFHKKMEEPDLYATPPPQDTHRPQKTLIFRFIKIASMPLNQPIPHIDLVSSPRYPSSVRKLTKHLFNVSNRIFINPQIRTIATPKIIHRVPY